MKSHTVDQRFTVCGPPVCFEAHVYCYDIVSSCYDEKIATVEYLHNFKRAVNRNDKTTNFFQEMIAYCVLTSLTFALNF